MAETAGKGRRTIKGRLKQDGSGSAHCCLGRWSLALPMGKVALNRTQRQKGEDPPHCSYCAG